MKTALYIAGFFALFYFLYILLIFFRTKVPYIKTPKDYYAQILPKLKLKKEDVVYDIGCGDGEFLFQAEKYGAHRLFGFELSPMHVWKAKLRAKLTGSNAIFYKKDFFEIDYSKADVIYMFLVPPIVNKVWPKIKNEAKKGCRIVVLSDEIEGEKEVEKIASNPKDKDTTYFRIYQI